MHDPLLIPAIIALVGGIACALLALVGLTVEYFSARAIRRRRIDRRIRAIRAIRARRA